MDSRDRPSRVQLPPAQVRMVPFALAGTALWALALLVIHVGDLGSTGRDTALAGIATGVLLTLWSHRMDRKLP